MKQMLEDKFSQVCDYFDFLKLSRCLEALEEEGVETFSVTELKEVAKDHFNSILDDLDKASDLDWVRVEGNHLELTYDEGELELRAQIMDTSSSAQLDEESPES